MIFVIKEKQKISCRISTIKLNILSCLLDNMSVKEEGIRRLVYAFWESSLENVKERTRIIASLTKTLLTT